MDRRKRVVVVVFFAILSQVLGILGWLGWLTGNSVLASVHPGLIPMAPNTATCFIILAIALVGVAQRWSKRVVTLSLGIIFFFSGVRLSEMLAGLQTGVESLLWSAPQRMLGLVPVGEMAMATAIAFLIIITSTWRLSLSNDFDIPALVLSGMSLCIGAIFAAGYIYGAPLLYGGPTIPMAFTTALGFIFASAAAVSENSFRFYGYKKQVSKKNRELNEALQISSENLRSLVDSNPNGLIVVNPEGAKLFANPTARELMEHPDFDLLARLPDTDHEIVMRPDRVFYVTVHSIDWRGRPVTLYSLKDISELRRSERKVSEIEKRFLHAQKMEALGRLAGEVAHDYNNLLTAIIGYATMLKESQSRTEELDEILNASQKAADLSNRLLSLSRDQSLEVEKLDLKHQVRTVERLLRRLLKPEIEFECRFEDDTQLWVSAVPSAVEQVVLNLVVNAQDALEGPGKISIQVDEIQFDEPYADLNIQLATGTYAVLKVSDSGCGIPADILPRIFEPYFTTKEKGKGTGLGLSTIYGIAQRCNGGVQVYSVPNRGTTFKVYFPLTAPPQGTPDPPKPPRRPKQGSLSVLLVEDDEAIRRLSVRLLERAGHKVTACGSAEEAMVAYKNDSNRYGLLVTDMVLPGQSGLELACRMSDSLPTILMSGYSSQGLPVEPEVLKRLVYLEKPFSLAKFESKVEEALGGR